MNPYRYTVPAHEKPLDNLVSDGGYASIFRTIACVGDSLSSGEFETLDEATGTRHYYDFFDYSWGQFLARMTGATVYNFSRGGMTAEEYCESYAAMDWWNPDKAAQAYILALGVNDILNAGRPLGEMSDICPEDPTRNGKTFTGYYARIIRQYKAICPDAKFFLVTMPVHELSPKRTDTQSGGDAHAKRLHELAAYFDNTYVIDLRAYGPPYDQDFREAFFLHGHMNPMGYRFTAEMIGSYIDYIIRHNPKDFAKVGFIGK